MVSWEKGKLYIKTIACPLLLYIICPGNSLRAKHGIPQRITLGGNSSLLGFSWGTPHSSSVPSTSETPHSSLLGCSLGTLHT
jgi:hypothetical protein